MSPPQPHAQYAVSAPSFGMGPPMAGGPGVMGSPGGAYNNGVYNV